MKRLSEANIKKTLNYKAIINILFDAFKDPSYVIPQRGHYELPRNNLSLVMPAWNQKYYGLKQIIACPENPKSGLPVISGRYDLFNVANGTQLCTIDAAKLTAIRTAGTALLASTIMIQKAEKIFIFGAGVVTEQLIKACEEIYHPTEIWIANRTIANAEKLQSKYSEFPILISKNPGKDIQNSDLILSATHTTHPIIKGTWINFETKMGLIGSYKKDQREVDDDLIKKSSIYVEDYGGVMESGELAIPLKNGIIDKHAIKASLFELCREEKSLDNNAIQIFKSVGHAIEDLAVAIYLYENSLKE